MKTTYTIYTIAVGNYKYYSNDEKDAKEFFRKEIMKAITDYYYMVTEDFEIINENGHRQYSPELFNFILKEYNIPFEEWIKSHYGYINSIEIRLITNHYFNEEDYIAVTNFLCKKEIKYINLVESEKNDGEFTVTLYNKNTLKLSVKPNDYPMFMAINYLKSNFANVINIDYIAKKLYNVKSHRIDFNTFKNNVKFTMDIAKSNQEKCFGWFEQMVAIAFPSMQNFIQNYIADGNDDGSLLKYFRYISIENNKVIYDTKELNRDY